MGRFFTSTQIYNPKQLDRDGFKADFCKKMKKEGYEVCEADCAELSYVLAFADNCKWVTISSEAYEQGNRTAQADTARIAKMLGTYCVNTNVIDSDCAMLDLYDDKGKKADTAIMGRADDYLGDDIPAPAKAVWEQFVSPDSTWEQFLSVVQGDYVFVEDGLSELAPVIEMASGNILFEYEDADENDKNFCYLSFRKASSKKEKKLTLNAAFKQIIGEALEPYGFKIIKGRHPYIVRVINNEILHIITFCPESPEYPEDKAFSIMGGVATIYRKKITFDLSPKQNRNWLTYLQRFYVLQTQDCNINNAQRLFKSCYYSQNYDSMINALKEANRRMQTYILPVFDKITDIDSCLEYCRVFLKPCNHLMCTEICSYYPDDDESFLYFVSKYWQDKQPEFLNNFINDANFHEWVIEEIERRKKFNTEILKSYGIDLENTQPKKEKKLTLNSAFVKIFGEALEPLGFVKIKSKHPYFVRVVNGEILHVITCLTESSGFRGKKAFQIYGGIATVYRDNIDLSISPNENKEWLETNSLLYYRVANRCTKSMVNKMDYYLYEEDDIKSMLSELKKALNITKQIMILYFDTIQNIDTCINHFFKLSGRVYTFSDYFEGLIFLKTANYVQLIEENIKQHRAIYKRNVDLKKKGFTQEEYEKRCQRHELVLKRELAPIENILTIPELYTKYNKELERRKKANLEMLKSYGIDLEKPQPKKEKKLTLNSAFVKVFGEALEPLGFVKIKSKHPYFVRVVNNEIIHIISYTNTRQKYHNKQPFTIIGGAFSVYRRNFNLDVKPYDNWDSLLDNRKIYCYNICQETYDLNYQKSIYNFTCEIDNNDSIISTMKSSLEVTEKIILAYLNKLDSIEAYFKELVINNSFELLTESPEELLFYNIDNFEEITRIALNEKAAMYKKCVELSRKGYTNENYENIINNLENYVQEIVAPIKANISESASEYIKESEYNKKENIEKLKSYGIDLENPQPKKEKKLTLNSAFVKVFGEALEPLGFKKVKSKYPYFAKIVNNEILQVITIVSRPDKRFEILGGIATVYRQSLSLDLNPKMNESWLIGNFYYYQQLDITNEERKYSSNEIYEFYGADLLEKEMKRAFIITKEILLDILDKVNSLEKCVEFYNFFGMDIRIHHKDDFGNSYPINYYNEGLLIIKTMNLEQYSSLMDKYKEITINRRKKQITNGGIPYERLMNEQEAFKNQKVGEYKDLVEDKDWLATVDIELNKRRNHNLRLLEQYGLI